MQKCVKYLIMVNFKSQFMMTMFRLPTMKVLLHFTINFKKIMFSFILIV